MAVVLAVLLALLSVYAQTTYYVTTAGTDSSSCGARTTPCASINQVVTNYPGDSYIISVAAGTYTTTAISLSGTANVSVQGTGNPTIQTSWRSGSYITLGGSSGIQWNDVSIILTGNGDNFVVLNSAANSVGLTNVVLTYSGYTYGDLVDVYGGSVVLNNVTLNGATFDSYIILDLSDGDNTSITVTGSSFSNLNIGQDGGFLVFDAYGAANILLNSTTFSGISTDYAFIGFWAEDVNQTVTITNNVFVNTNTYLPNIYIENDYQCVISVSNSSWNNATASFVCAALETLGPDDGTDHNISLSGLTFNNCNGNYAGAVLVGYNSLTLSNSNFSGNSAGYGNDVVQGLDSYSSNLPYTITNSYSSSALPKAVIWNLSTGSVTDISSSLPNPSRVGPVRQLTRKDVQASPKFGRKPRKN